MRIKSRGNIHILAKAPGAVASAFDAGDELFEIDSLNPSNNKSSFEVDFYNATAKNREPDLKDSTLSFSKILDTTDPAYLLFAAAYNNTGGDNEALDICVVYGTLPAVAAKNKVQVGRYIVTNFTPKAELPGVVKVDIELQLKDGATFSISHDVTAYPSL